MTELVQKTTIVKEKGCLYFCKESEDGFIVVYKSKAGRPAGWRKNPQAATSSVQAQDIPAEEITEAN